MFNIIDYVSNNEFKIIYTDNKFDIVNYDKINYMDDDKISLSYKDKNIKLTGKNLRVKKLLDDEIMVIGNFDSIIFKD